MRRSVNALVERAAADLLFTRGVNLLAECADLLPVDLRNEAIDAIGRLCYAPYPIVDALALRQTYSSPMRQY